MSPIRSLVAASLLSIVAMAGCIEAPVLDDRQETSVTLEAIQAPKTEISEGEITFSATTPVRTVNNGGTFNFPIEKTATTQGFIVIVTWDAETPASQELQVWVRQATQDIVTGVQQNPQGQLVAPPNAVAVEGASPLRVAFDASKLPAEGAYDVLVRAAGAGPAPVGVAATQMFTFSLTTFDGVAFDAEHVPADK